MATGNSNAVESNIETTHDVMLTIISKRNAWVDSLKIGDTVKVSMCGYTPVVRLIEKKKDHFKIERSDGKHVWVHRKRLRRGAGYAY